MKNKRWTFEIMAILAVAALLTWSVQQAEPPTLDDTAAVPQIAELSETDIADLKHQWADHYAMAQEFLSAESFLIAEQELLKAQKLALRLPAGDKSLAETLDDLGQVYFRLGKPGVAMQYQGQAVAALLLAGGPQDRELGLYIKRYGWAQAEFAKTSAKAFAKLDEPHQFLAAFAPVVPQERFAQELGMLESDYQKLGNSEGLAVVAQVRQGK